MSCKDRCALVTGSSRGIGKAIAQELARQGYAVAVHGSKDSAHLQESFEIAKQINPNSICLVADLADAEAIDNMFDEIQKVFGQLNVLVNNAAVHTYGPLLEMELDNWDQVLAVNLRAAFLCGQRAALMMKQQGGGKIVNISSVHDTAPQRNFAHYSSAKAGLAMLTKCMALEWADHNIQANYLTVGGIATAMTDPERVKILISSVPAGRIGESIEVAKLVAFIASEDANYITGSSITIDGGLLLGFCATRRDL